MTKKKSYKKPEIKKVNLVVEDAVLSNCKAAEFAVGQGTKSCDEAPCKKSIYGS